MLLVASTAQAGDLDIERWLARPGVRLLAVEFYATWCKPCMQAVPQWKALHEKYRDRGLRLVVVATRDPRGQCVNPGWNPDDIVCDVEGHLADALRIGDALPAAFLWSWRGGLLVRKGHVEDVAQAVKRELASLPRLVLEAPAGKDAKTLTGIVQLVRAELAKSRKLQVIAGKDERRALANLRKASHSLNYNVASRCEVGLELAANSLLRTNLVQVGKRRRLILELLSATKGCLTASASVVWNADHPSSSVAEAVMELMQNLKVPVEMPGAPSTARQPAPAPPAPADQSFGDANPAWDPNAGRAKRVLVTFASKPAGAVVMVDGRLVCAATPCREEVPAGAHQVSMQLKRHQPRKQRVGLNAGAAVVWTLEPDFATVDVLASVEGLPIELDGKVAGNTPLRDLMLEPGSHTAAVRDPCWVHKGKRFTADKGKRTTVTLEATPVPAALDVSARQSRGGAVAAEVLVDGRKVGVTPGVFTVGVCAKKLLVRHATLGVWEADLRLRVREVKRFVAAFRTPAAARPAQVAAPAAPVVQTATPGGKPDPAAGLRHYEQATRLAAKRQYEQAATLYHAAYAAHPRAVFLIAAARTEMSAGQYDAAEKSWRRYIDLPESAGQTSGQLEAGRALRRIQSLRNASQRNGTKAEGAATKYRAAATKALAAGEKFRAAALFRRAIAAGDTSANGPLAALYADLGQEADCVKYGKAYLAAHPDAADGDGVQALVRRCSRR